MDAMLHNLNAARYLMGRRVVGRAFFSDDHTHSLACDDTQFLKVDFEQGASAHLFITWAAELAVYDSANGARVGTLLWGSEKEADWQAKAQMEDLDHDGIKEIGISMADGEILWYHYREGLEDTWPENKCGCFEKVD